MTTLRHSRAADLDAARLVLPARLANTPAVDPVPLLGRWVNTDLAPRGMATVEIARADGAEGGLTVRVHGAGPEGPLDWGATSAELFYNVEEEDLRPGVALAVRYELGFMTVRLQIRPNKGVLVVAAFTRFLDGSGRRSYFTREFFVRPEVAGAAVP